MDKTFGNSKDNLIAVATIAVEPSETGEAVPAVRTVDACYEDGAFYAVTNAKSNKMPQIEKHPRISVAGCTDMFTAEAIGKNLGWVLNPEMRQSERSFELHSLSGMMRPMMNAMRTAVFWK